MSSCTNAVTSSTDSTCPQRLLGRVKWFNNRAGYGFITVTDGCRAGSDVFVHHSSVKVDSEQYKYLVQGEYVEFTLLSTPNGEHEFQAGDVSGVKGGKLMCETRRDLRVARSEYRSTRDDTRGPRQRRPTSQSQGQSGWSYVGRDDSRAPRGGRGSRGPMRGRGGRGGARRPRDDQH